MEYQDQNASDWMLPDVPRSYKIGLEPTDTEYISRGFCPDYALRSGIRANTRYWPEKMYDFIDGPNGEPRPETHGLCEKKMQILRQRMEQYILYPQVYDDMTEQTLVFIELDNVLADFHGALGKDMRSPSVFLEKLSRLEISFDHLWLHIKSVRPIILIKNSHFASVENSRVTWCKKNLCFNKYSTYLEFCVIEDVSERKLNPDNAFYIMFVNEMEKFNLSKYNSVLIDANESNAAEWESRGGVFLPYKNDAMYIHDEIIGFIRHILDVQF
jgi:hypothetical protein